MWSKSLRLRSCPRLRRDYNYPHGVCSHTLVPCTRGYSECLPLYKCSWRMVNRLHFCWASRPRSSFSRRRLLRLNKTNDCCARNTDSWRYDFYWKRFGEKIHPQIAQAEQARVVESLSKSKSGGFKSSRKNADI